MEMGGMRVTVWIWFMIGWVVLSSFPVSAQDLRVCGVAADGTMEIRQVTQEMLSRSLAAVTTVDPNFTEQGITRFSGIPLGRLADLALLPQGQDLTFIGSDQYISFFTARKIKEAAGILAVRENGRRITPYMGGPRKLIFPRVSGLNLAAYTWYVDGVIQNSGVGMPLGIRQGKKQEWISSEKIAAITKTVAETRGFLSIPNGYRHEMPPLSPMVRYKGILLTQLFDISCGGNRELRLIPLAGRPVVIPADRKLLSEIQVVTQMEGRPLHPAYGGPYSVMFSPSLSAEGIPDSGALFFLSEIVVAEKES